jgi:hypothetical protein
MNDGVTIADIRSALGDRFIVKNAVPAAHAYVVSCKRCTARWSLPHKPRYKATVLLPLLDHGMGHDAPDDH